MPESILLNNRYQLEDRLGTGGMAMVYRARDLMLERTVAIKLLKTDFSNDEGFRERFRQEAKAAANLSHPNIVTVHDFGLDTEQLFIVMEYVPGMDLKTILQRRGRFNLEEALNLIIQACAGIGYAHRAGLVHCDVKPQNMLVTPDKRLKVVDFGIARALVSIMPEEKAEVVWGSPQYFSPEQAAGAAPSPASDVYSLGVVFYEMLTGQLPFSASTPEDLARLHRESLPPSPRQIISSIPIPLEQIMIKVLSKEPSARYRTADQLGRVLVSFIQHSQATTTSVSQQYTETRISTAPAAPPPLAPVQKPEAVRGSVAISKPVSRPKEPQPTPKINRSYAIPENDPLDIDWITWLFGLLALIAVGGLIPFWLWVYYVLNPPL
jgi:eukaryotic-like serine/threonine-protein kinase